MREGFTTEDNNKAAERRRRRGSEVIDEEEAPQVVIQEKDKDAINAEEARAFVAEKAGVKAQVTTTGDIAKETGPVKAREENVSLGMMKKKRKNEGVRRAVDQEEGEKREEESGNKEKSGKNGLGKTKQTAQRKEKRLKLSFEEDE